MTDVAVASAPAKAMLFGEYAVLEGAPALALALDRRIVARAARTGRSVVRSELLGAPLAVDVAGPCPHPLLRYAWPLLQAAGPGLELDFPESFPANWGLGSSSASTLAAAAALRAATGRSTDPDALFADVLAAQRAVQGAASGYDAATQLVGGLARFVPGPPPSWDRPASAAERWTWAIAWTGAKVTTGSMIRSVRERFPVGAAIYGRIGELADEAVDLLARADRAAVGEALNRGQRLLEELGASPDWATETARTLSASPGVLGARLSGAGGGDCLVLLAEDRDAAVRAVAATSLTLLPLAVDFRGLVLRGDP